jgi:hypothetical protein
VGADGEEGEYYDEDEEEEEEITFDQVGERDEGEGEGEGEDNNNSEEEESSESDEPVEEEDEEIVYGEFDAGEIEEKPKVPLLSPSCVGAACVASCAVCACRVVSCDDSQVWCAPGGGQDGGRVPHGEGPQGVEIFQDVPHLRRQGAQVAPPPTNRRRMSKWLRKIFFSSLAASSLGSILLLP